jgi:hypothetical protein
MNPSQPEIPAQQPVPPDSRQLEPGEQKNKKKEERSEPRSDIDPPPNNGLFEG